MMKKLIFYLLTAVCALLYAPPAQADTLYFYNENWDSVNFKAFSEPYCYFGSGTDNNGTFLKMTRVPGETLPIYKVDYTRASSGDLKVLFIDGTTWDDSKQTVDLTNNNANGQRFRINKKMAISGMASGKATPRLSPSVSARSSC